MVLRAVGRREPLAAESLLGKGKQQGEVGDRSDEPRTHSHSPALLTCPRQGLPSPSSPSSLVGTAGIKLL